MLLPLCFRRRILPINSGDVKRLCRGCVHLTIIDRIMAVLLILISAQPSEVSSDESLVTLSRILLRMSLRRQVPETVLSVSVQEFRLSHTSGGGQKPDVILFNMDHIEITVRFFRYSQIGLLVVKFPPFLIQSDVTFILVLRSGNSEIFHERVVYILNLWSQRLPLQYVHGTCPRFCFISLLSIDSRYFCPQVLQVHHTLFVLRSSM